MTHAKRFYVNCQLKEFRDHPHSTKLGTVCRFKSPYCALLFLSAPRFEIADDSSVLCGWRVRLLPIHHHCEVAAICWSQFYGISYWPPILLCSELGVFFLPPGNQGKEAEAAGLQ